jgi:hypothetical protein
MEGAAVVDRYFKDSFKPTQQIIADNASRFADLADVDDIRALGHSLADVDLPYLQQIAAHTQKGAAWRISYYGDPANAEAQFAKIGATGSATCLLIDAV